MRLILGIFIAIGLIILTLLIFIRLFFHSAPKAPIFDLTKYANTNTSMVWTQQGPVQSDQTARSVKIIVNNNQATIDIIQGYQGNVIATHSYPSNPSAYAVFLRALYLNGYNNGVAGQNFADSRGVCPQGQVFTYQIVKPNGDQVQSYWATTCAVAPTLRGNSSTINILFQQQIPDYGTLTGSIAGLY